VVKCCLERTEFGAHDNNLSILSGIFDSDFGFDDRIARDT
jgi:hypothetical protein